MHSADSNDGPTSDEALESEGSQNPDDGIAAFESTDAATRRPSGSDHSVRGTSRPSDPNRRSDRTSPGTPGTTGSSDPGAPDADDGTDGTTAEVTAWAEGQSLADGPAEPTDPGLSVSLLSTPGDGSCGIGTYADSLLEGFDGVETERLELAHDARSRLSFLRLALRAGTAEGDVVHVQHEYGLFGRHGSRYPGIFGVIFFPVLYIISRLTSKNVVVTLHSVLRPGAQDAALPVRLYLLLSHNLIAALTDHVVFLSEDCQDRFLADVALDSAAHSLLPHGVAVQDAADVSTAEAKARFDFDAETTVVMIPGFMRPPKGHDIFIDVAEAFLDCEFFIAGGARPEGDDFAFADDVLEAAPANVTASGVLEDEEFHVALQAADLAFLPYRVVTQSGTFNWCAAHELPVLASDEPYFSRMERRWNNIETVDVTDREAIIDALETLLVDEDRREELSEHMATFKAANDFRTVAREHLRIYQSMHGGDADAGEERREAAGGHERRAVAERSNAEADEVRSIDGREPTDGQWRAACSALRAQGFGAED